MRLQMILVVLIFCLVACGGSGSSAPEVSKAPQFTSSATFSVDENQTSIGIVTATDEDSSSIKFSISGSDINIDEDAGTLTFTVPPDYEVQSSYSATVTASDGSNSTNQSITVNIVDVDEPAPSIVGFAFYADQNPALEDDIVMTIEGDRIVGRTADMVAVDSLVATFEFEGSNIAVNGVAQKSGVTANDYSNKVAFSLTATDGQESTYTVDLARFTGLPVINLYTDNGAVIDSKEDYVKGQTSITGGRHFDDFALSEMKIRGRGNSTWFLHPKKPFQMKLDDKAEFLGMPRDKKWLFLAEYSDKTMLRNRISFEMGYISHLDWTPQGHFAEVFLNDQYNGTYNITQKVEESDNRVVLGDTGYLLELDQLDRLDPDDVYFESSVTELFLVNIKEPKLDYDSAEYLYIEQLIHEFETALFSDNFRDATNGYAPYIDLNSFIDWYLISEITKNVDSQFFSSIYLNVMPGERIKMGPLWDFDLSFGNVDYADSQYAEGWWVKYHPWYERLFQDPDFVTSVKSRFQFFMQNQDFILEKIDNHARELRWAQQQNDDLWQTLGIYVWPNPVFYDTYQEEVDHLKSWYVNRMNWLDAAFEGL